MNFINSTTTDEIIRDSNLSQPAVNAAIHLTGLKTDFLTVGTAAVNRSFRITPVHPETKSGVMWRWNHAMNQAANVYEVGQLAKLFPHHNVGIVSQRGIGNLVFLDIDGEGVLEQIERETGQKMPLTYTVQSRPQSAPWKRHFYFTQTAYSFEKFGGRTSKQINVKDLTKVDEKGRHPNRYDVKACGGAGYVVAAGCIRDTGEMYTIVHDVDIIPIPNWLADWLWQDRARFKAAEGKERTARAAINKLSLTENVPFDVSEDDIHQFLKSRAGSLASLGLERKTIEHNLAELTENFCAGGKAFAASPKGKEKIRRLAFDPSLKMGNADFFRKKANGLILQAGPPTRHKLIVDVIKEFPPTLSSADAYNRLQQVFAKEGMPFDRKSSAAMMAAQRARKQVGFEIKYTPVPTWVRMLGGDTVLPNLLPTTTHD